MRKEPRTRPDRAPRQVCNGLLIPTRADGARALCEALTTLMRDETQSLEFARAAPGTVKDYEPEKVSDFWEDLFYGSGRASKL